MNRATSRKEEQLKTRIRNKAKAQSNVNPLLNKIVRGMGSVVGGLIDPMGGSLIGDGLADSAHRYFKQITGFGDYKVNKNSIMTDSVPTFAKDTHSIRVAHREYMFDMDWLGTSFTNRTFYINPGNRRMFPWLYWLSQCFEQYKFHGLVIEFKTTAGNSVGSTNTALGTVILATQYNALDTKFSSKYEMENYQYACSTKPSVSVIHPVECAMRECPVDVLYIRNQATQNYGSNNLSNADPRLYDLGILNVAGVGAQAANINCGEVWISYDVELFKPRPQKNTTGTSHYQSSTTTDLAPLLGMTEQLGGMLGQLITLDDDTITFDPIFYGTVVLQYNVDLSAGSLVSSYSVTPSGNASVANILGSGDSLSYESGGTSALMYLQTSTFLVAGGGVLTFAGGVLGTRTAADLIISCSGSQ